MITTAPHILTPKHENQYNLGTVSITWDSSVIFDEIGVYTGDPYDPYRYSLIDSDQITYEIEYTDDYRGENTNWYTLKRRISLTDSSYDWIVGKMIKSASVRIRMRIKNLIDETESEWSISETFSINVFDLVAPAIVNPVANTLYTDFILIILDETLTKHTYYQKVRYTLNYSSRKQDIGWTRIVSNVPTGQNVIRWNIEGLPTSDDYILRLTAQNASTSCLEPVPTDPDQISHSFIYSINIQQSGLFIIDTKPPEAVLEISGNAAVTNQINQVVNIFAEDTTTGVQQIQLRECNAGNELLLGDLEGTGEPGEGCPPLVLDGSVPFDRLISDTPISNLSKIQWIFDATDTEGNPISTVKKLEALLTDTGGNNSLQENTKNFLTTFNITDIINDFTISIEQRDKVDFGDGGERTVSTAVYEVAYIGTASGQLWVLEPFSRLIYTTPGAVSITKLYEFNDIIFLFTYDDITDTGEIYRHDVSEPTSLYIFSTSVLAKTNGVAEFNDNMYIGMESGELWRYNGVTFVLVNSFSSPISYLFGDNDYLYIGFHNEATITLYTGSSFISLDVE